MRLIAAAACAIAAATIPAGAVDLTMDLAAVDAAVRLGQSRAERERAAFHAGYRFTISKAPLDYIELITPFRRVVLTAETRVRIGDRVFGQRQAREILAASDRRVDVHAEFTLHPLNNFIGVPDYMIFLEGAAGASGRLKAAPTTHERIPRFGARVEGAPPLEPVPGGLAPGKSQPLLGGTVIAHFDRRTVNESGVYDLVVEEAGKELGRVRVDFAKLR